MTKSDLGITSGYPGYQPLPRGWDGHSPAFGAFGTNCCVGIIWDIMLSRSLLLLLLSVTAGGWMENRLTSDWGQPVSSASKPQTGNKLLASPNVSGNSASWWCQSGDNRGGLVLEADLVAGFWEMKLGPCKEVKQNS